MLKRIKSSFSSLKSKLNELADEQKFGSSKGTSDSTDSNLNQDETLSNALVESLVLTESKRLFFQSHDYSDGFSIIKMHELGPDFFVTLLKCKAVQEYGQDYGETVVVDGLVPMVLRCCDCFLRMIDEPSIEAPKDDTFPDLAEDEWSIGASELLTRKKVCLLGMRVVDSLLDGNWIVKSLQAFQKHVTAVFAKRKRSMIVEHLTDLPLVKYGAVSVEGLLQLKKKFAKCDSSRVPEIIQMRDVLERFLMLFQRADGQDDINVYSVMLSKRGPGLLVLQYATAQDFFDQRDVEIFPISSVIFDTVPRVNLSPQGRCMIEMGEFEVRGSDLSAVKQRLNMKISMIKFVLSKTQNLQDDAFFITKRIFFADTTNIMKHDTQGPKPQTNR